MAAGNGAPWVFDADGHIVEPPEVWTEHLPEKFRAYAPQVERDGERYRFVVDGRGGFWHRGSPASLGAPGQTPLKTEAPVQVRGATDPAARLDDMAIDHIGMAALYPTFGLMIQGVTEREPALALCRAINDWLAGYIAHDPGRLIGVATLPLTDAGDALREAKRCVEELGFKGAWRRPEHFGQLPRLQDDVYEPLWSYLEEADVPFVIHPGLSGVVPFDAIEDRFGQYYSAGHAMHFVMEQQFALTTFIAYGILERHPLLRVGFLETGAMWALAYIHRLDEHLEVFGFEQARLSMKPSDYFSRQCFVSVEEVEPGLGAMLDLFPESIVFSSDYPHGDGTFPGSTKDLLETDALDKNAVKRVLLDNALRLYGVPAAS
jgi:predicted TIM-barrel fold metal-dependent hydrolase